VRKEEKRARRSWRKFSNEGERIAIVVAPRFEEIFVLWVASAISWCRALLRNCSGC